VRSLQGLKKKLEKFDMVMFETTGLADPAPIMKTFQQA
jgi:G3E family GTPase